MKVFYHNDPDGRLSAFWVKESKPNNPDYQDKTNYIPLEYKDPIPLNIINTNETVYILDFSFEPKIIQQLLTITKNIIWIDHHESNIGRYDHFLKTPLNGIHDTRFAACVLTYWYMHNKHTGHVTLPVDLNQGKFLSTIPLFTTLVGDWDAWRHDFGELTKNFYAGLHLDDTNPFSTCWNQFDKKPNFSNNDDPAINQIAKDGETINRYRTQNAKNYLDLWSFELIFDGIKTLAVNFARPSSVFFESQPNYDLYIGFVQINQEYQVSLYSHTIDVSLLAKKYGGGGHKGAAGFICKTLPWNNQ